MHVFKTPFELESQVGKDLGKTDWMKIEQDRINLFAEATGDHQWIHVDVEKAKQGPFGAPIAHGYLTASLANYFLPQLVEVQGTSMGVNYGCDKIRFPSPVKVGSRIRGAGQLTSVERTKDGGIHAKVTITIEIEGSERPACVIETISRFYPA
jgi:acyl dehydratase